MSKRSWAEWLKNDNPDRDRALTVLMHDLTNPLNVIAGASAQIRNTVDNTLAEDDVKTIIEMNSHIYQVTSRLLDLHSELLEYLNDKNVRRTNDE